MAKGKSPAFQFYPDAWLSSTSVSLMTPAEEGAYIRLLCHAWQAEDCGLPDDDEELAVLSRLRDEWEGKSARRIRAKFSAIDGRLYNNRLIEERQKQLEWSSKSIAAGKKSGESRRGKNGLTVVEPNANQMRTKDEPPFANGSRLVGGLVGTKCEPTGQPNTNSSSSSSSSSSKSQSQPPCAADAAPEPAPPAVLPALPEKKRPLKVWFDEQHDRWYLLAYWRHIGKHDSRKAFEKRVCGMVDAESFGYNAAVEFLCGAALDDKKRFEHTEDWEWRQNLHPATWLNQERWKDEAKARDSPSAPRRRETPGEEAKRMIRERREKEAADAHHAG